MPLLGGVVFETRSWKLLSCAGLVLLAASASLAACGDDDDGSAGVDRDASADASASEGGKSGSSGGGTGGHAGSGRDAGNAGGSGGSGGAGGSGGSTEPEDSGTDAAVDSGNPVTAVCGNGVIEDGEDCDDGGSASGDGCSETCERESGWICTTDEPTSCEPRCGDGKLLGAETDSDRCDDGHTVNSDGCDSSCHVEVGYSCAGEPSVCTPLCGNGVIDGAEGCDDQNAATGDGCAACVVETHWNCGGAPSSCVADLDANVLIAGTEIAALSTRDPAAIGAPVVLIGMIAGDVMVAIDRRPNNGMLYGLGFNSTNGTVQLYLVGSETGQCVPLGSAVAFSSADGLSALPVSGPQFDIDFNPPADRLRVVTSSGQNFRLNPNTGAPLDNDSGTAGYQMDAAINGATMTVQGVAYSNNSINQPSTTVFALDQTSDSLYIQNPPNNGTQTTQLALSSPVDFVRGFDIPTGLDAPASNAAVSGDAYAVLHITGQSQDSLARVNLGTAAVSNATPIGSNMISLALQNIAAIPMLALSADGTELQRFSSTTPNTTVTVAVTLVAAGDVLVGIDYRPQTGQLYALGVNDGANTATLYLLDPSSGVATAVGTAGQIAYVDGSGSNAIDLPSSSVGYGFDFNPTVDRIRVVTGTGLNFRLNPNTGAAVDGDLGNGAGIIAGVNPDASLNGLAVGSTGLSGVAYTNSYAQPLSGGVTTVYGLDPAANGFYIINPPNAGTATHFVAITSGGVPIDFTAVGELDIADARVATSNVAAAGVGYAALTVGGIATLYAIDLTTGAATDLGQIGGGSPVKGLAVGRSNVK